MNNIKKNFTIKDLENISGIKSHTIRIWEKRYNLLTPQRTDTNIRYYSSENLQKLLNVVLLNNNDYKISKIAKMSDESIQVLARELALNSAAEDEAIDSMKMAMFNFDVVLFNNTYNQLLHDKTFREIFKEVFMPFLNQIGLLWQTDTLLPIHEHFISNLIAQKIQINIDRLENMQPRSEVSYVLFLPENEIHELGLMYLNYELTLRGNRVIYLGQNVPLNNLSSFFQSEKKICFITVLTVQPHEDKVERFFDELEDLLKDTDHKLLSAGRKAMDMQQVSFKADISVFPTILDLLDALELNN